MAIYTYRCPVCDRREEVVQSISSYCVSPRIPTCRHPAKDVGLNELDFAVPMERYLTPCLFSCDATSFGAFKSMIDGEVIDSRSKQKEHMSKHGVVLFDDIAPDIERNKKAIQEERRKTIKGDLVEAVHKLEAGHKPNVIPHDQFVPAE
jgi:hypothetical protein